MPKLANTQIRRIVDRTDRTRSAVDSAAQTIRDHIANGKFVPGQRLIEIDLIEQLGVSKTVLREAFAKLQQEGLLVYQRFKGVMVRRLSVEEFTDISEINSILLAWAVYKAAENVGADPSLRERLSELRKDLQTLNPRDQREHTSAFYRIHDQIVEMARNPYLSDVIRRGWNPLVKEFFLDALEFGEEIVAYTRQFDEVLQLVENAESKAAFDACVRYHMRGLDPWILTPLESQRGTT